MLNGDFSELPDEPGSAITFIPRSMIGPPEKIHVDMRDTGKPGLVFRKAGTGTIAWLPFDLGSMYYRLSLPAHAGLFRDVVNRLCPERQIQTDAHPLVEMTYMQQGGRKLLHLVNFSGHSQTGYFEPLAMKDIHVRVAGRFATAKTIRNAAMLPVRFSQGYTEFTVPRLGAYELVVME
jgi:hypothetical protein